MCGEIVSRRGQQGGVASLQDLVNDGSAGTAGYTGQTHGLCVDVKVVLIVFQIPERTG